MSFDSIAAAGQTEQQADLLPASVDVDALRAYLTAVACISKHLAGQEDRGELLAGVKAIIEDVPRTLQRLLKPTPNLDPEEIAREWGTR